MPRKAVTAEEDLFNRALGKHIGVLRQRAGLSQRELSRAVGMTQQSLASIECGRTRCAPYRLAKIARRLGLQPAALMQNVAMPAVVEGRS